MKNVNNTLCYTTARLGCSSSWWVYYDNLSKLYLIYYLRNEHTTKSPFIIKIYIRETLSSRASIASYALSILALVGPLSVFTILVVCTVVLHTYLRRSYKDSLIPKPRTFTALALSCGSSSLAFRLAASPCPNVSYVKSWFRTCLKTSSGCFADVGIPIQQRDRPRGHFTGVFPRQGIFQTLCR